MILMSTGGEFKLNEELEEQQRPCNKYEMVILAAREARRINELARTSGQRLEKKPALTAIEKVFGGEVKYVYEGEPQEREEKREKPGRGRKRSR